MNVKGCVVGCRYRISGDLENGRHADGTPRVTHEDVVRKVTRITETHVICECGRRFIVNDNLKMEAFG